MSEDNGGAPEVDVEQRAESEAPSDVVVVAVGASAGGLDAFKRLIQTLPSGEGLALVLIQHLAPTHESLMVELLSRHTSLPVHQVTDGMPVEADHVYMIPPNQFIRIEAGHLFLDTPVMRRGIRLPIDYFLSSLAEDRQQQSISIILTGTGSDGADGIRNVKSAGGMTIAQDPESAEYDGMPRAAIGTGSVDLVLRIEDMPSVIVSFAQHPYVRSQPPRTLASESPSDFKSILNVLRANTGQDFTQYKKGTLTRRIERRMGIRRIGQPVEYLELLRDDSDEVHALFRDMLIGVTRFFRDSKAWDDLGGILGRRIAEKDDDSPLRVWVPGCSTGEEAYTLAILLFEQQEAQRRRLDIQLFATDIDPRAIEIARAGRYPQGITNDVSEERIEAFFEKAGDKLTVRKRLRESCIFAVQNMLSDPPFSNLDLISCRNVLIYLEGGVQSRLFDMFHFALKPKGLLFLGASESPAKRKRLFSTLSQSHRVYEKRGKSEVGHGGFRPTRPDRSARIALNQKDTMTVAKGIELAKDALLKSFAPASAVVNADGVIQYLHGPVRDYMDLPTGHPELDLGSMVFSGLKMKVRTATHRARTSSEAVSLVAHRVRREKRTVAVEVRARQISSPDGSPPLVLVSFMDVDQPPAGAARAQVLESLEDLDGLDDATERELALELQATREDLQSTIEELESANEELKASNEEVMSMNEELQSTNEELETSREELQSLNEELSTVNNQLHDKVGELEKTTDDLTNFLASTDIATLFLDEELRIRRFTPATVRLMSLLESDIGRPLSDLSPRVEDPRLEDDARQVLEHLTPAEAEVVSASGAHFMRRITPFRTANNLIAGVVVTYSNVTRLKEAARRVELRARQQSVTARLGRDALITPDLDALFERSVRDVTRTLGVEYAKILRLETGPNRLALIAGVGWDEGLVGSSHVPAGAESQGGYTLHSGGPVITSNLREEKRFSGPQLLVDHDVAAGMSVVIGPEEEPWGVLGAHTTAEVEFTVDDTNFMLSIANVLWAAIRRRHSEAVVQRQLAEIELIYQHAPIGLCFIDRDLRYVRVNDGLARMNGVSVDDHVGKRVREVMPDIADTVEPLLQQILDTGEALHGVETKGVLDDGGEEHHWMSGYAPLMAGGTVAGVSAYAIDVTDRRKAEEALDLARSLAESASKAKTEFLANMSHEIRSPLTAILGFADLLQTRLGEAKDRTIVNNIRENGNHLCQILDDILDLSKVESGTLNLHRERSEVAPIFAYIRSLMGVRAERKGLTFSLEFEGEIPSAIETDARMLRQILLNLVGNAIKFTPKGGVRLVTRCEKGAERLVIDVIDSGIGIDPSQWESIFAPFQQVDSSSTREAGGTGLGLSITKRLVEALGGTITLQSGEQRGTTFRVSLPTGSIAQEEPAKLDSGHLAREDVGIPLDQLPALPGRIMVVEDRDDIRLLVQELIETVGGEVVTASDGSEAVSMWIANRQGKRPVDAVLMDIQMPLMDGIEATRRLREEGFEGGVVALTAGVMDDDRRGCLDAGCDEIVSKPIDPVELIHKLVPWVKRHLDDASGALSILSVEDHLDLASVQKTLLEARGHFVTVASNAEQAMEAVEHFAPDAVLMDLGLPGVSGVDILLRMRERPDLEGCTFICVSGRDESEVPWQDIGFDAFLRKPTSIDEIVRALTGP